MPARVSSQVMRCTAPEERVSCWVKVAVIDLGAGWLNVSHLTGWAIADAGSCHIEHTLLKARQQDDFLTDRPLRTGRQHLPDL